MEEIKINKLDLKPSGMLIVGMEGKGDATLNKKWQEQEIDFLMKDVGVGGKCQVEIIIKGQYTNITKVNMESYTKGTAVGPVEVIKVEDKPTSIREDVGKSIVAQCLTKAYCSGAPMDISKEDVLEAYKYYLENL